MEKQERMKIMHDAFVEVMHESYESYRNHNSLSEEQIEEIKANNAEGISELGKSLASKLEDRLFAIKD